MDVEDRRGGPHSHAGTAIANTITDDNGIPTWGTEEELIAATVGHGIGWDSGYRDGYRSGHRSALAAVAINVAELELLGDGWRQLAAVTAEARLRDRRASLGADADGVRWLAGHPERARQHDRDVIAAAGKVEPIRTWDEVAATVAPAVWARIWGDLAPGTQLRHRHLDPRRVASGTRSGSYPAGGRVVA